jgi:peptidoglycan hydrolase-like protein with peptidoglycan-binding domain/phenylpyruvate tautomerase PptA (4-oxalocrotonate tautomerase family)
MKKTLITLLLVGGLAALLATVLTRPGEAGSTTPGVDRAIAETVTIRTLTDEMTIRGELRRDELQSINSSTDGRISGIGVEAGEVVAEGDALFSIDGRQTVAVTGHFAFYRQLDVGSDGHDVLQLETILEGAGYEVGDVDGLYTEETRSGLAAWQADHGYAGTTAEVNEVVTVSLQGNPAGYTVGAVNAVSVRIGPAEGGTIGLQGGQAVAVMTMAALVVDAVSAANAPVPTISLSAMAVVVEEGRPVVVTVTADVAPTADLEIPITISGDVTVDDDFVDPGDSIVLPAGRLSATLEIVTLLDEDREPYEDLKVSIGGGFDSLAGVAPRTLVVYDLQAQIDDKEERRAELVDEITDATTAVQGLRAYDIRVEIADLEERRAELVDEITDATTAVQGLREYDIRVEIADLEERRAELLDDIAESVVAVETEQTEVNALETLVNLKTDVEQELMDKGIITMAEAIDADYTPTEADQLMVLETALEEADSDLDTEDITVSAWRKAFNAYYDALEAAGEESAELEAARDALEAETDALALLRDEQDRLAYRLEDAEDRLADTLNAEDDSLALLRDEQQRLTYLLETLHEDLRVAQAGRYVLSAANEVTVSIDDPDVPDVPILVLRADSETVSESGMATFTIETTVELVEDLDVFYVLEGTATPDVDFNAPDGDITMKKGLERVTLSIPIRADDDVEADESVTVRLIVEPSGAYRLSDRDRATIQIKSADLPELTLTGGGEVTEGDTVIVTIQADQAPDKDTSVNYSVSGSAQAGVDYEVVTGTALLPAGQLSVDIPIRTILDDVFFMPGDMVVADWPARVGSVEVEEGDLVQRATPLFNLTDPGFTITLFASPTDRSKLAEGQLVTVNLASGGQEVEGIITHLDDTATTSGGSETYEGVVETAETLVGVDGAVVTIDVVVEQSLDAVVVPIAAVLSDGGQEIVRVVTPEGVIERRAIETGMLDGAYVEVVTGVAPGEYVILEIDRS